MTQTISPRRVLQELEALLEEVCNRGREFVIARGGKPMAAFVPVSYVQDRRKRRDRVFRMIEEVWKRNRSVPSRVLQAEVDEAVRSVRSKAARRRR